MDFDDLDKFISKAEELNNRGTVDVPFEDYFPEKFMREHTSFTDIYKFLNSGNFDAKSIEDIDTDKLDAFIKANSDFEDWESFKHSAGEEYALRELGFND